MLRFRNAEQRTTRVELFYDLVFVFAVTQLSSPVGAPHYVIYVRRPVTPPSRCDLYLFDFATAQERKLTAVSTRAGSEYLPTVWGDRIVFARVYPGRRGRRGVYPYIYTARLDAP
jgi:hypothetical protein